jgi:uncharacterized protein YgbK (DUF1537 family)
MMTVDMVNDKEIERWIQNCPEQRLLGDIQQINRKRNHTCVVLDDDPTGTQTMNDVPVVTVWDVDFLTELFQEQCPVFYILTNSRSMSPAEATDLVQKITRNLELASAQSNREYKIILRSDSTLRGHHPEEMNAVFSVWNKEPELKVLHPAFIDGGRFTFKSVHYAKEGHRYVPCGETQFAKDPAFGYSSSHLGEWIIEKTNKRVMAGQISTIPVDVLRRSTVAELSDLIKKIEKGNYIIADSLGYFDLDKFCLALLNSERTFIARTGASFVASITAIEPRPLLKYEELAYSSENGGLIVAGSFVEKTTRQIQHLSRHRQIVELVLNVKQLLQRPDPGDYLKQLSETIQTHLDNKEDVLLYTSRELLTAEDTEGNFDIGKRISEFISGLVGSLSITPSFLIAKGGITSSDIATKSLGVKRARIMGQLLPGVPVWQLGSESKFPGMPYVVFPGNVGGDDALLAACERIKGNPHFSQD